MPVAHFLKIIIDFPVSIVFLLVYYRKHTETCLCSCLGCKFTGLPYAVEGDAFPSSCDLGKEAMLNGIPFRSVWRIMRYDYVDSQFLCQSDESLLEEPVGTGVGASTVTKQHDGVGMRVDMAYVTVPKMLDVVAGEFSGVMTCTEGHISDIPFYVVNAVRYYFAGGEGLEVMVFHLRSLVTIDPAIAPEGSDKFLFLGVHAKDRDASPFAVIPCLGNLLELRVAVLAFLHGDTLQRLSLSVTFHLYYLIDDIYADVNMVILKFHLYYGGTVKQHSDILVLREAAVNPRIANDLVKRLDIFRMYCDDRLPSSARLSYTSVIHYFALLVLFYTPIHGILADTIFTAYYADTLLSQTQSLFCKEDAPLTLVQLKFVNIFYFIFVQFQNSNSWCNLAIKLRKIHEISKYLSHITN